MRVYRNVLGSTVIVEPEELRQLRNVLRGMGLDCIYLPKKQWLDALDDAIAANEVVDGEAEVVLGAESVPEAEKQARKPRLLAAPKLESEPTSCERGAEDSPV